MKKVTFLNNNTTIICDEGTACYLESITNNLKIADTTAGGERTSFVIINDDIKILKNKYQTLAMLLHDKIYKIDGYKIIIKKESYLYYYNFIITIKNTRNQTINKFYLFDMVI